MKTATVNDAGTAPGWVNCGRAWGMFLLGTLFGVGAFFLLRRSLVDGMNIQGVSPALVILLFGLLALLGLVKGEIIFRRKVMARSLARARLAIGETGWRGDAPLAPFCMLSLYRPWKVAHAISSWVLIPLMVGLAIFFRNLEGLGLSPTTAALIRGPVYFGIGLALAYGAGVYLVTLLRFVMWWANDGRSESIPLPAGGQQLTPAAIEGPAKHPETTGEPIAEGR